MLTATPSLSNLMTAFPPDEHLAILLHRRWIFCSRRAMMVHMAIVGKVRVWDDEEGWGVIDSDSTPGGCWAHYSNLAMGGGYRALAAGQLVQLEWERVQNQDGYFFRAVRAWPHGQQPEEPTYTTSSDGTGAFHSSLTITRDEPPTV